MTPLLMQSFKLEGGLGVLSGSDHFHMNLDSRFLEVELYM